jgi:hypothetical protein
MRGPPLPTPAKPVTVPLDGISEGEIREQLTIVLQSKAFLSSRRCSAFLRYVVDRALADDEMNLREGAIAQTVFGRTSVAEGIDDSVVRVCAREVRKRLERYYAEPGAPDAVSIQLPVGTYMPRFCKSRKQEAAASDLQPVSNLCY